MIKWLYLTGAILLLAASVVAMVFSERNHNSGLRFLATSGVMIAMVLGRQYQKIRVKAVMEARSQMKEKASTYRDEPIS